MEQLAIARYRSYQGGYFQTIISPEQTDNKLALLEFTLSKGSEPPPHIHTREDESFYVLDGEVSVTIDGKTTILRQGEGLFAPRNIPHSFKILTERATLMNLITPGSLWNYFIEFSEPLSERPGSVATPGAPPLERMKAMIDTITNVYHLKFL